MAHLHKVGLGGGLDWWDLVGLESINFNSIKFDEFIFR